MRQRGSRGRRANRHRLRRLAAAHSAVLASHSHDPASQYRQLARDMRTSRRSFNRRRLPVIDRDVEDGTAKGAQDCRRCAASGPGGTGRRQAALRRLRRGVQRAAHPAPAAPVPRPLAAAPGPPPHASARHTRRAPPPCRCSAAASGGRRAWAATARSLTSPRSARPTSTTTPPARVSRLQPPCMVACMHACGQPPAPCSAPCPKPAA